MAARFEAVLEAGAAAPWLVMVHGMTQDRRVFGAQVAAFRQDYRILHGLSTDIPGPFGHRELSAAVAGALDEAAVRHCHFWATHTGTALGLLLAAERPDRFHSLILEGAVVPGRAMASVDAALEQARDIALSDGVPEACRQWCAEGAWFEVMRRHPVECRAEAHREMVAEFSGAPWLFAGEAAVVAPIDDSFPSIDMPVLLYNGEHDLPDFLEAALYLEARLPRARREMIPEAGGFPAWEFPERVNRRVAEFLGQV